MLAFANLEVEKIEVDLKNKPESLFKYSPKGTVPVLVLEDGTVIDESLDIVNWVMEYHRPKDFKDLDPLEEKKGMELLENLHDSFITALNRYKYASRYENVDLEKEEEIILRYFEKLSQVCKDKYIFKRISKYDVLIFPFIRQANIANQDWVVRYKNINIWFDHMKHHDIFSQIMQK